MNPSMASDYTYFEIKFLYNLWWLRSLPAYQRLIRQKVDSHLTAENVRFALNVHPLIHQVVYCIINHQYHCHLIEYWLDVIFCSIQSARRSYLYNYSCFSILILPLSEAILQCGRQASEWSVPSALPQGRTWFIAERDAISVQWSVTCKRTYWWWECLEEAHCSYQYLSIPEM